MSRQINLFNPIFLKQRKYFSVVTMMQALGIVLLGVAVLAAYAEYQALVLRNQMASTVTQLNLAQSQLMQVTASAKPRAKSKELEGEIQRSETELEMLDRALTTLQKGDLGNTKGYADYMRAFSRQVVPGLWLTGFNLYGAGNQLAIQGRALKPELVPEYLNRLKREPAMQGKAFDELEMRRPKVEPKGSTPATSGGASAGANASAQATEERFVEFSLRSAGIVDEKPARRE